MSTDRETTRIVRSWLEEGVTALPDRVLDAVLDQVPATPQRRSWWPSWRTPYMNNPLRYGVAAAAVLVVAVIGYQFLPGIPGPGAPTTSMAPTTAPSPTAEPVPTAVPEPTPLAWPRAEATMEAGTYSTGSGLLVGVTATVPTGWSGQNGGPNFAEVFQDGTPGGLSFQFPSHLPVDPCDPDTAFVTFADASAEGLVAALKDMPTIAVSGAADVTVDGYSGTQLVVTAAEAPGPCAAPLPEYPLWQLPLGPTWGAQAGAPLKLSIVDVEGVLLVIVVDDSAWTSQQKAELQAVVDSIELEPAR